MHWKSPLFVALAFFLTFASAQQCNLSNECYEVVASGGEEGTRTFHCQITNNGLAAVSDAMIVLTGDQILEVWDLATPNHGLYWTFMPELVGATLKSGESFSWGYTTYGENGLSVNVCAGSSISTSGVVSTGIMDTTGIISTGIMDTGIGSTGSWSTTGSQSTGSQSTGSSNCVLTNVCQQDSSFQQDGQQYTKFSCQIFNNGDQPFNHADIILFNNDQIVSVDGIVTNNNGQTFDFLPGLTLVGRTSTPWSYIVAGSVPVAVQLCSGRFDNQQDSGSWSTTGSQSTGAQTTGSQSTGSQTSGSSNCDVTNICVQDSQFTENGNKYTKFSCQIRNNANFAVAHAQIALLDNANLVAVDGIVTKDNGANFDFPDFRESSPLGQGQVHLWSYTVLGSNPIPIQMCKASGSAGTTTGSVTQPPSTTGSSNCDVTNVCVLESSFTEAGNQYSKFSCQIRNNNANLAIAHAPIFILDNSNLVALDGLVTKDNGNSYDLMPFREQTPLQSGQIHLWSYTVLGSVPAPIQMCSASAATGTQPPVTQPPTQLPATTTGATQPPVTQPPATTTGATQPPVTQPPTQPPATTTGATQPPVTQNPGHCNIEPLCRQDSTFDRDGQVYTKFTCSLLNLGSAPISHAQILILDNTNLVELNGLTTNDQGATYDLLNREQSPLVQNEVHLFDYTVMGSNPIPIDVCVGTGPAGTTGTVAPSTTGTVAPSTTGTVAPSTTGTQPPVTTGTNPPSNCNLEPLCRQDSTSQKDGKVYTKFSCQIINLGAELIAHAEILILDTTPLRELNGLTTYDQGATYDLMPFREQTPLIQNEVHLFDYTVEGPNPIPISICMGTGPRGTSGSTAPPATTGTAAPSTTGTAAPSTTGTDAPATTGTVAPSTTGTDAPATTGTVAPSTTGTDAPATTGTVAPSTTGTDAPATTGTDAPATTGTVAPSTTGTVAPSTTGTVAPSTTGEGVCFCPCACDSSASATTGIPSVTTTTTGGNNNITVAPSTTGSATTGTDTPTPTPTQSDTPTPTPTPDTPTPSPSKNETCAAELEINKVSPGQFEVVVKNTGTQTLYSAIVYTEANFASYWDAVEAAQYNYDLGGLVTEIGVGSGRVHRWGFTLADTSAEAPRMHIVSTACTPWSDLLYWEINGAKFILESGQPNDTEARVFQKKIKIQSDNGD
eukprot:gene14354-16938_t